MSDWTEIDPSKNEYYSLDGENTSLMLSSQKFILFLRDEQAKFQFSPILKKYWEEELTKKLSAQISKLDFDNKSDLKIEDINQLLNNIGDDIFQMIKSLVDGKIVQNNLQVENLMDFANICIESIMVWFAQNLDKKNPKFKNLSEENVIREVILSQKKLRDMIAQIASIITNIDTQFGKRYSLENKNQMFTNISNALKEEGRL